MHERDHLRRLANLWERFPIYFITTCTARRRPLLVIPGVPERLIAEWRNSDHFHGWSVGNYVVMPDHVHFFVRAKPGAKALNAFIRDWKKWTAKEIGRVSQHSAPIWQHEFFDHVLRSANSYAKKWNYVRENPVRAGLVTEPDLWPYSGACVPLRW